MAESLYLRQKALEDKGVTIRRANHFEQTIDQYGTRLRWVIDRGEFQALKVYPTKLAAIEDAERNEY